MIYPLFIFLFSISLLYGEVRVSMEAVSPVTPLVQVQLENDLALKNSIHNIPQNTFYVKPIYQIEPFEKIPFHQILRIKASLVMPAYLKPYKKAPSLNDTQILDLLVVKDDRNSKWGVGAIAILPTATTLITGQGKWQIGPAVGMTWHINQHWQLSLLLQNPISLFGNSNTPYVKSIFFQPSLSYHFGDENYLISNAEWTFQWNPTQVQIPVNIGIGKVFKYGEYKLDTSFQSEWMAYKVSSTPLEVWTLKFCLNILH